MKPSVVGGLEVGWGGGDEVVVLIRRDKINAVERERQSMVAKGPRDGVAKSVRSVEQRV